MSDIVPSEQPERSPSPPPLPFRLPAEYYSQPAWDVRPLFPRWVPVGCGIASVFILLLLFAGGAFFSRGGAGMAMDFVLGMMETEMVRMYAKDVSATQKQTFSRELTDLREGLRSERVPADRLQPVLRALQNAVADESLSAREIDSLLAQIRAAKAPRKRSGEGARP